MNVAPLLLRERLMAWGGLAGALILSGLACWWAADDGTAAAAAAAASAEVAQAKGPVSLVARKRDQEQANKELSESLDALRHAVGFTVGRDFRVPANTVQPGLYFNEQFLVVQDRLRAKAHDRNIRFQDRLGFERIEKVPPAEQAEHLLIMLQLTERAAQAVIDTPANIIPVASFAIVQVKPCPVLTGPTGRPPLLQEYPLQVKLQAKLTTILWILHRLAHNEGEGSYPLVVRSLVIDSKNLDPKDDLVLDATIEVAGMRFLSAEERATAGKPAAKPRSGSGLGAAK